MRASARIENAIGLTPEVCEIEFRIEAGDRGANWILYEPCEHNH